MSDSTSVPMLTSPFQWPSLAPATPEQAFRAAIANLAIPKFYANMYTNVVSPTELTVMFANHGIPSTVISFSYAVAKSLSERLAQAVKEYEEKTGSTVLDTDFLEKAFQPK